MTSPRLRALLAAALASALPAFAANVLHVTSRDTNGAWQFDWRGTAATVVSGVGRAEASVVAIGPRRLATLAAPLSQTFVDFDPDCPTTEVHIRRDVLQLAVTRLSGTEARGTSAVVEIGTTTTLDGCNAGRVVPFGAPGDAGIATQHLAAALRPSKADLSPGVTLAGPSDQPGLDGFPAVDVTTFGAGALSFAASGGVYATDTVDGWLVLSLPFGQRGYTRVAVDRAGAETWVAADWSAGLPQRVFNTLMVKPAPGAGFGTPRQAARIWESGLFSGSNNPFYFYLYRDGSGERVSVDMAAGTELRSPVRWRLEGETLVTVRDLGSGLGHRTWVPLRNSGSTRFVLESESIRTPGGGEEPFIAPRINFYLDEGAATPPPPAARPHAPATARQPLNRPRT